MKEFNTGPFNGYRRFHNYLVEEVSITVALRRLHAGILTPRKNRFGSMFEAFIRAEEEAATVGRTNQAESSRERALALRYHLKRVLTTAHEQIDSLGAEKVFPLACYEEPQLEQLANGAMAFPQTGCSSGFCSVAAYCRVMSGDLKKLTSILKNQPSKWETVKRLHAIEQLCADHPLSYSECRDMGDAVFALLAPREFVILTTNVRDHKPLARA